MTDMTEERFDKAIEYIRKLKENPPIIEPPKLKAIKAKDSYLILSSQSEFGWILNKEAFDIWNKDHGFKEKDGNNPQ